MTLTIDIPDNIAARFRALSEGERERVDQVIVRAIEELIASTTSVPSASPRLHSVLEVAGVGKRQPGAIGDDVQGYIDAMRGESRSPLPWDEFAALMVEGMDPHQPPLPDYALSRESMYED